MTEVKVGSRVGAVCRANETTVELFGYGVYGGDVVPAPELGVTVFGQPLDIPNPQIILDDGKQVFGCECWWGPEDQVRASIGDREVVMVDIEAKRAEAQAVPQAD